MNQHDYYISESNYTSYDNNSKNKFKYYIIKKKIPQIPRRNSKVEWHEWVVKNNTAYT